MRKIAVAVAALSLMGSVPPAQAGCITGAIAGGLAGHLVHHGIAGAVAGCAAGHYASKYHRTHGSYFHRRAY